MEGDLGFPCILEWDGSGTVVAAGSNVLKIREGDRVSASAFPKPKEGSIPNLRR